LDLHEAIWVCFGHARNNTRNKMQNAGLAGTELSQARNPKPEETAAADYEDDPEEYLSGVRLL
jgi:hypothetical protein